MIAYRFAEVCVCVRGGGVRDGAKEGEREVVGSKGGGCGGSGRKKKEKSEDTKEQDYFSLPETVGTINCCCFTISLVPTTTVLDSDACVSHNNSTHSL